MILDPLHIMLLGHVYHLSTFYLLFSDALSHPKWRATDKLHTLKNETWELNTWLTLDGKNTVG